ncbi:MAG: fatty acid desaturase [Bdellovibrionales bacterium]|nr:fatty acid desaturase [Bdellovibrionales bacterium]
MNKKPALLKFDPASDRRFHNEIQKRANEYFRLTGQTRYANGLMWFKSALFFGTYWVAWHQAIFGGHSALASLGLTYVMGFLFACIAYNIAHDSAHGSFSKHGWVNNALFWVSFNMLGTYSYLWRIRHKHAHHLFVNVPDCDIDIEGSKLLRLAPHSQWKPYHRFQHLYGPVLYSLFTFQWLIAKDWKVLRMKRLGNLHDLHHSGWRAVELAALKLAYVGYMIVIPAIYSPFSLGQVLFAFATMHLMIALHVAMTLAGSHLTRQALFLSPDSEGTLDDSFSVHQLKTSIDFHPTSRFFSFFFGGFNSHVAHHLFPTICSVHYRALTRMIQEVAREMKLPYLEMPLWKLYAEHLSYLKYMGADPQNGMELWMVPEKKSIYGLRRANPKAKAKKARAKSAG